MYLSPDAAFNHTRDHPDKLVWEEQGLSYDWAEGNARQRRLNVSRPAVLQGRNGSVRVGCVLRVCVCLRMMPVLCVIITFAGLVRSTPTSQLIIEFLFVCLFGDCVCASTQAVAYFAHVFFTRTDFPFDPEQPHLTSYKRICEYVFGLCRSRSCPRCVGVV